MFSYSKKTSISDDTSISHNVHRVLARSYAVYFLLFLLGVALDIYFQVRIFMNPKVQIIGAIFLFLATILILWAQSTSRNLEKKNITKAAFCKGPYCYSRSPTHWGLFILMIGFGIIANALFVIIMTIIAFIITKTVFLKQEEDMLVDKYGAPYQEYKDSVSL